MSPMFLPWRPTQSGVSLMVGGGRTDVREDSDYNDLVTSLLYPLAYGIVLLSGQTPDRLGVLGGYHA